MSTPLLIAATGLAWAQPCGDPAALIAEAEAAVVGADITTARQRLGALEDTFGCGRVADPTIIGRMWLVDGALTTFTGDPEGAVDAWVAASRVAPGHWLDGLGTNLREDYEEALTEPTEPASIRLDPPLPDGWFGAVDGRGVTFPAEIPAGLHLVQAGPTADEIVYGTVVLLMPGPSRIRPDLGEAAASAPRSRAPRRERAGDGLVSLWLAAGTTAALGEPITAPVGSEPEVKVVVPVELGLLVRVDETWLRAAASGAPLLGGDFLWSDGGTVRAAPLGVGGHLAGGLTVEGVDLGMLVGASWPGRVPLQGTIGFGGDGHPLHLEARLGANMATERAPEPSAGIALALVP